MENKIKECFTCEQELNAENTVSYGGFDSSNHYYASIYGGGGGVEPFTKCDSCFDDDNDRHLENLYS